MIISDGTQKSCAVANWKIKVLSYADEDSEKSMV